MKTRPCAKILQVKLRELKRLSNSRFMHFRFSRNNFDDSCSLKTFPAEKRNYKMVIGPMILLFVKGRPSKLEMCKRIFDDLHFSNLDSAEKK